MIKNYFKIAFRNLIRRKVFSFINIFGLAIGMACTILILLWVQDELSYDKFFENADNTYLVLRGDKSGMMALTSKMLAPALKQELPEIKNSTSFMQLQDDFKFLIQNGDKGFEESVIMADTNFFKVLSYKFREGNLSTALSAPNSIILTAEAAKKYFDNETAIGKTLKVSSLGTSTVLSVSGILENIPLQSQIQSQVIIPVEWFDNIGINFNSWDTHSFQTYIQLTDNSDIGDVALKIRQCEVKNFPDQNTNDLSYSLIPLTKIHLYGSDIKFLETTGDIKYVHIFIVIAIILLLIAGINYMNLSTALALKRTKEVGIKKTLGANRNRLMLQFMGESFIFSFISYCLAVLLVELLIPEFNFLTGKKLSVNFFDFSFIGFSLLVIAVTGIISGSYPALFLSSFSPIQILKRKIKPNSWNLLAGKGLVVFQFVATVAIISGTIVVFNQLSFISSSNIGFDKENLLCIRMNTEANRNFDVLKNEFMKNPDVVCVSRSEPVGSSLTRTTDVDWPGKAENEEKYFWMLHSDINLAATYKFQISNGRYFSNQYPSDKTDAYVINESAAKSMGLKSPINNEINVWARSGKIIGVVKDFHFSSFHNAIEPLIIQIPDDENQAVRYSVITIRFNTKVPDQLISYIEKVWHEQMAGIPFDYYFYDDSLNNQYFSEIRMSTIFEYFSFLSILIACLGLFGLVSFSVEQRTKEIGIRKVLGASVSNLVLILSKDFLILVIISNLIAWPLAYYFMNGWLEDFAYKVDIGILPFLLAGSIALLVALVTVSYQSVKAAVVNPIESIRYE